jgi:hypothetical protein
MLFPSHDPCLQPFTDVMYDAAVGRQWGNICPACFDRFDCDIGTGRGQRYELQEIGSGKAWVKVAG